MVLHLDADKQCKAPLYSIEVTPKDAAQSYTSSKYALTYVPGGKADVINDGRNVWSKDGASNTDLPLSSLPQAPRPSA